MAQAPKLLKSRYQQRRVLPWTQYTRNPLGSNERHAVLRHTVKADDTIASSYSRRSLSVSPRSILSGLAALEGNDGVLCTEWCAALMRKFTVESTVHWSFSGSIRYRLLDETDRKAKRTRRLLIGAL